MTGRARQRTRVGLALTTAYLVLAALAVAYPFYKRAVDPANAELSGVPLIAIGLPWSLLIIELAPVAYQGIGPLLGMTLPGVLLNAWLLYFLARKAGAP